MERTNKNNDRASDDFGRIKGHKNIYVQDGALIPGSTGVNPYAFITALAERNMATNLREEFVYVIEGFHKLEV